MRNMPAPKGNTNAIGNKGGGRKTKYRAQFAEMAQRACEVGFTDKEISDLLGVCEATINEWKLEYVEFSGALKAGKAVADDRVERSLYHKAVGYSFDAVKIFMPANSREPVYAPYREQVAPDTTAAIFWLKNRRSEQWRDKTDVVVRHEVANLSDDELTRIATASGGRTVTPPSNKTILN